MHTILPTPSVPKSAFFQTPYIQHSSLPEHQHLFVDKDGYTYTHYLAVPDTFLLSFSSHLWWGVMEWLCLWILLYGSNMFASLLHSHFCCLFLSLHLPVCEGKEEFISCIEKIFVSRASPGMSMAVSTVVELDNNTVNVKCCICSSKERG